MSTRANIGIKGEDIYIYKHHDGYPHETLPVLEEVVDDFINSSHSSPSYLLAQIMRGFARRDAERRKRQLAEAKEIVENPEKASSEQHLDTCKRYLKYSNSPRMGGWGITDSKAGDIEYYYEVDLENNFIIINDYSTEERELIHIQKRHGES